MFTIVLTTPQAIEEAFKDTLPPKAIRMLCQINEQQLALENAINKQNELIAAQNQALISLANQDTQELANMMSRVMAKQMAKNERKVSLDSYDLGPATGNVDDD